MARVVEENEVASLVYYFSQIPDPRIESRCEHLLIDVLVITICAVLCGAQSCTDFEDFGHSKESWLRRNLELPNGIPSHDTFRRVLSIIDPIEVEKTFQAWVQAVLGERKIKTLSIDGKAVGGATHGGVGGRSFLHLVNVYSQEHSLCLGQIESNGSGGETTAALELIDQLDIKDTLISADARFAVRKVVEKIRSKKGHYLVALKDNNKFYRDQVIDEFEKAKSLDSAKAKEMGHGRAEERKVSILKANEKALDEKFFTQWPDLKTLIRIERTRVFEEKRPFVQVRNEKTGELKYVKTGTQSSKTKLMRETQETSYYLSSKKMSAKEAMKEVRKHWGIENGLHWVLDVAFAEDDWLARAKRLSRNLAALRRIGLNLIRSNASLPKKSIRRHMKTAGWNDDILESLVFG